MPSIKDAVWNLDGVPDLPREKQLYILRRLQARVHELFDALVLAEEFIEANLHYSDEMEPIYTALGRKRVDRSDRGRAPQEIQGSSVDDSTGHNARDQKDGKSETR